MPTSVWDQEVQDVIDTAKSTRTKTVEIDGQHVEIPFPFPSPLDWRDHWIYFLMIDRFNRPGMCLSKISSETKQATRGHFLASLHHGYTDQLPMLKAAHFSFGH